MESTMKNPMQPIVTDNGVVRFKSNRLVRYLLDYGGIDMNHLASVADIPDDDRMQFAQLIGYSVSGFGNLDYADSDTVEKADQEERSIRGSL